METQRYNNNLLTSLLNPQNSGVSKNSNDLTKPDIKRNTNDSVNLSKESKAISLNQTRLISENIDKLDNGYRRTQKFENAQGKTFTRIEEFTNTNNQSRRTVVQQNASGSTSRLEDIFDRQQDGSFRLTQRYTNEVGDISVNIKPNAQPPNSNFILGKTASNNHSQTQPLSQSRGSEINLII